MFLPLLMRSWAWCCSTHCIVLYSVRVLCLTRCSSHALYQRRVTKAVFQRESCIAVSRPFVVPGSTQRGSDPLLIYSCVGVVFAFVYCIVVELKLELVRCNRFSLLLVLFRRSILEYASRMGAQKRFVCRSVAVVEG